MGPYLRCRRLTQRSLATRQVPYLGQCGCCRELGSWELAERMDIYVVHSESEGIENRLYNQWIVSMLKQPTNLDSLRD
jgi:hypothetical protein